MEQRKARSRGSAASWSVLDLCDHRRSATADALGHTRDTAFVASTCSPHMQTLPPISFPEASACAPPSKLAGS
eukprot:CAMPEP_0172737606 /NCGR_PEP_ID=MMETSP1074-20121228/118109_1 /TAXON_ID=2916 /ORGANISM="Ceratium fusus, Strain PA161109" /LENGTH=72 /DNA_ID=CAMNT_0013567045 /DNA_START=32 /DNA_END=247 /DNA_ORIENTATION=+